MAFGKQVLFISDAKDFSDIGNILKPSLRKWGIEVTRPTLIQTFYPIHITPKEDIPIIHNLLSSPFAVVLDWDKLSLHKLHDHLDTPDGIGDRVIRMVKERNPKAHFMAFAGAGVAEAMFWSAVMHDHENNVWITKFGNYSEQVMNTLLKFSHT